MAEAGDSDDLEGGDKGGVEVPDTLLQLLAERMGLLSTKDEAPPEQLLDEVSLQGIATYIKSKCTNLIVMTGAGISTAAGIPDFRSPGTGLYDNLQKYELPSPQSVFDISYFKTNPEPFYMLAKELYPSNFIPTKCHYFIRLLAEKGKLLRHYTQNVDTLERVAGIPDEKLVEAHGSFNLGHCIECHKEFTQEWIKDKVFADEIPHCDSCNALVKPDIVFFGEALPDRFASLTAQDLPRCDMLIVIGTSLTVQPFASLAGRVPKTTPRLLINRDKAGETDPLMVMLGMGSGFNFSSEGNYRDVFQEGDCDDGCVALAELLGWKDELLSLVDREHAKLPASTKGDTKSSADEATSSTDQKNELETDSKM
ncbi:NAD-dependent protein deacetylase sirtuin-2-like [Corticium candelabrum]|uniref:NAD-dependent protein deacetylase sirtuin-2-like n=1 Tax=Corticium candelabrum TaxID=121492 RepID=UPI002E25BCB0|nr:NAD-dependent protein deacetylase sirtuin-2-like [Corticium candelabrum]